jgi:hypothetical protein
MPLGGPYTLTMAASVNVLENDASSGDGVFFTRPGVVVVKWDSVSRSVCIEWQGWADPTEFAAANEAGLRALREHHTSRWLADLRNLKAIQQSDQDWITRDWFPRMLAAGLTRMALVNAKSGLAMMNIRAILARVPSTTKLDVGYFTTVDEAREWLAGSAISPLRSQEATVDSVKATT